MGIKYLGAAGPNKWLPEMDSGGGSGARSSAPSQKRPLLPLPPDDGDLVELLWQDGTVVARSQAQARNHQRAFGARGTSVASNNNTGASGVTVEEESEAAAAALWFPDGCGALGGDMYAQLWRDDIEGQRVHGDTAASSACLPPLASTSGGAGSSFCGSNAVTGTAPALLRADDDGTEPGTSFSMPSSGRSASGSRSALLKRTRDDEFDAAARTRASRRRSAEVHNLSEKRRRDRINEKMRALQELVPHCNNKTDKASVLDEAIECLKSLQMQVQIMWMTTGMAPTMMMLPGAHRLMSSPPMMGMGFNSSPTPQVLNHQMQRVPPSPFMNNPAVPNLMPGVSSAATGDVPSVANQVQKDRMAEPRNPFLHPNDAATHEVPPSFFGYESQMAHQNEIQELLLASAAAHAALGVEPPSSSDGTGTT